MPELTREEIKARNKQFSEASDRLKEYLGFNPRKPTPGWKFAFLASAMVRCSKCKQYVGLTGCFRVIIADKKYYFCPDLDVCEYRMAVRT